MPRHRSLAAVLTAILIAAACSGGTTVDGAESAADDTAPGSTPVTEEPQGEENPAEESPAEVTEKAEPEDRSHRIVEGTDGLAVLPVRPGPREETTNGVPHIQIDGVVVPEVDAELERRAYALPGVEKQESTVSLPGARSLWLADDVEVIRPEVLQAGREFAHIHPNGSLHVWLPIDRAIEVAETKWGEFHPWVGRDDFWDGLVMVYTPETLDELDVTMRLIVDAYNYVTGADIDPGTIT